MSEITPEYVKQLQAELADAKKEAAANAKKAEKAAETLKASGVAAPVDGSYKGYSFPANFRTVRNKLGEKCDTQTLLDKAKEKNPEACAILDYLIEIKFGYFTKK